jgi:hypothetical protein
MRRVSCPSAELSLSADLLTAGNGLDPDAACRFQCRYYVLTNLEHFCFFPGAIHNFRVLQYLTGTHSSAASVNPSFVRPNTVPLSQISGLKTPQPIPQEPWLPSEHQPPIDTRTNRTWQRQLLTQCGGCAGQRPFRSCRLPLVIVGPFLFNLALRLPSPEVPQKKHSSDENVPHCTLALVLRVVDICVPRNAMPSWEPRSTVFALFACSTATPAVVPSHIYCLEVLGVEIFEPEVVVLIPLESIWYGVL